MIFSIIIPVYNTERYIEECIESVLLQDFPKVEFEIVVVDDCSPDKSYNIVKSLSERFNNVRLIKHNRNKHLGGARNTGIREAKGNWLFFLDSDDKWIDSNVLQKFWNHIQRFPAVDIFRSVSYSSFCDKNTLLELRMFQNVTNDEECLYGKEYVTSNQFFYNVWTSCYSRFFLINNNLYFRENVAYEDSDWSTKTFYLAPNIILFDNPFYGYRLNETSITNTNTVKTFNDNIISAFEVERLIYELSMSTAEATACRNRIKQSIITFVKLTKQYKYLDGVKCLSKLKGQSILQPASYNLSLAERIIFYMINSMPRVLVIGVKVATIVKRGLVRLKI